MTRQESINIVRNLGYNGDLRKGSAKYFHDIVKEHKRAAKLGFDSTSWNDDDVHSYFAPNTYFAQVEYAVQQIMASVDVALPAVLQKFAFFAKIESVPQDHSLKISHTNDIKQIKSIIKNFLDTFIDRDDSVPNTKWRIHEFKNEGKEMCKEPWLER